MNNRVLFPGLLFLLALGSAFYSHPLKDARAVLLAGEKTLVLYDAALGGIPDEALMDFTDFPPGAASQTYVDSTTVMDTTVSGSDTFAGWVSSKAVTPGFPILERTVGVQVNFALRVESEVHTRNNRAGFSVIILDKDARGIELSFWENEIWAQNDNNTGGLFTHGEGAAFPTTASLTDYQVTILGDTYTLTVNSLPLLSGPVRDYSAFEGFPDPYETPNFLFWGDDTTSAQARVRLGFASVTGTEPVLPTPTAAGTATSSPLPTASVMPPASVTPLPTPAPAGRVFELCSSGFLLLAVTMTGTRLIKKIER